MTTTEIGFSKKFDVAVQLTQAANSLTVRNAQEHAVAEEKVKALRDLEKELEAEYKAHPVIVESRRIQEIKSDLSKLLEGARKSTKAKQMAWEDAQERIRRAEEERLAAEAKKKAEAEAALILAAKRKEWEAAEKAKRAAEKKGDAEAQAAAAAESERIKAEAAEVKQAAAVVPVVVLEKTTPTTTRRMASKFRIKDANLLPRQYLMPNEVAIGGVIRSLKQNHGIPGVEYYEIPV